MCSEAIHWARISKVVFGISQAHLQSVSGGKLKPAGSDLINIGNQKVEIVGPVLETEGMAILKKFPFRSKKEKLKEYQKNNKPEI